MSEIPHVPFEYTNRFNPEEPGSRFTDRAALAILTRPQGQTRFDRGDTGDSKAVVSDALGQHVATEPDPALGEPSILDAGVGRGASGWAPVIEWVFAVAVGGVIGSAAWEGVKLAAWRAAQLVRELKADQVEANVSRGYAALLAIEHVLGEGAEAGILDVEGVGELSRLAGREISEVGFVGAGAEPWMVLLLNEERTQRYLVLVNPDGAIEFSFTTEIGPAERAYVMVPPRDLYG